MTLLPQRKKSAEEIQRLRDSLGVPLSEESESPAQVHREESGHQTAPAALPADQASPPVPHLPVAEAPLPIPAIPVAPDPPPAPKPVRSLRKSERVPVEPRTTPRTTDHSTIPARRHSDRELQELRRRDALARFDTQGVAALIPKAAPLWIIIPAYLTALGGLACQYWKQIPLEATGACVATAALFASGIALWRPLSRHHAAFLLILILFAAVFGALHYFPHLRHAT